MNLYIYQISILKLTKFYLINLLSIIVSSLLFSLFYYLYVRNDKISIFQQKIYV